MVDAEDHTRQQQMHAVINLFTADAGATSLRGPEGIVEHDVEAAKVLCGRVDASLKSTSLRTFARTYRTGAPSRFAMAVPLSIAPVVLFIVSISQCRIWAKCGHWGCGRTHAAHQTGIAGGLAQ